MNVNRQTPVRPKINNIQSFSDAELTAIINAYRTTSPTTQCLVELLRRITQRLDEQNIRITHLEQTVSDLKTALNPPKAKCGRKRQQFTFCNRELDDDELLRLIDGEYISISQLEKEVGASKNQLRRRYERAKEKQERAERGEHLCQ
jgi:hypothetical protein